jgi:hypothetical protein
MYNALCSHSEPVPPKILTFPVGDYTAVAERFINTTPLIAGFPWSGLGFLDSGVGSHSRP